MKKKIGWVALFGFILLNVIAYNHAYRFTHYTSDTGERTRPEDLTALAKAEILFTGISNPRPKNNILPESPYTTVKIQSDVMLEGWLLRAVKPRGTVLMFHGYTGNKSQLLTRAEIFQRAGYNTLLIDLLGSGGSEGNETHLGYTESAEVRDCYEFAKSLETGEVHLFGTSMGAVAIMKAVNDYGINPASIIIECPFGSLYDTVSARFRIMGVPPFPMAAVLTFWGGIQLGFQGFKHNPIDYAAKINTPTLLLFGEKDDRVSIAETNAIYDRLPGSKKLITYPSFGHDLFTGNEAQWEKDVTNFMDNR